MIYENKNIKEPTCPGEWWRRTSKLETPVIVTVFWSGDQWKWRAHYASGLRPCEKEGVTWTSPIIEPEAKPTPRGDRGEKEISDGEFLKMLIEECPDYEGVYEKAAARFRAECIAPYETLEVVARAVAACLRDQEGHVIGWVIPCSVYSDFLKALSALPDQGETPAEEKPAPHVSEGVGIAHLSDAVVVDIIRMGLLDMLNGLAHADIWPVLARVVRAKMKEKV